MLKAGGRFMTEATPTELPTPPAVAHTVETLQTEAQKKGASPAEAVAAAQKLAAEAHHDAPTAKED